MILFPHWRRHLPLFAAFLAGAAIPVYAQPATQFGDNFNNYTAGAPAGGFSLGKNGSVNVNSWTIVGSTANKQYRGTVTNHSYAGGGVASALRGVPYIGGLNRKAFTMTTTMRLISTTAGSYNLGVVMMAGSQPHFLGSYYRFSISEAGTPTIHSSNTGTTGLVLGTATSLPSGLAVGATYTFRVEGSYNGAGALSLNFSVTNGTNTATLSASAATPLTGAACGYEVRVNNSNTTMTVDVDDFNVSVPMTYSQVFVDEFEGTALNSAIWHNGYRWADNINGELQAMRHDHVSVGNGVLTIRVTNPPTNVQNQYMGTWAGGSFDYASGAIQTYDKWRKAYGYFEARIKMPTGKGTWPAFWLLPDRGPSYTGDARVEVDNVSDGVTIPSGAEIDITEYMASWKNSTTQLSKSHSGVIWSYADPEDYGGATAKSAFVYANDGYGPILEYPNADTQFHTYGVHWEPGIVTFYLDGKVVYNIHNAQKVPVTTHYMVLCVALHQDDWTTAPNPTLAEINAGLPCQMEVDYVRVYDVAPGAATVNTRAPIADAYVRDGSYQNTNYGTATALTVKNDTASYNREGFLKFNTDGLSAYSSVLLKLVPVGMGTDPTNVRVDFVSSDSWTETGLTWANRPAGSTVQGTVNGPFVVGQPITVNVTTQAHAADAGDNLLSLKVSSILNGSNRVVDFGSRENTTSTYRPVLSY